MGEWQPAEKALEKAAAAYYAARPLHSVFKSGASIPVPWEEMLSSKDPVRVETVRRHREAIRAAIVVFSALSGDVI